MPSRRLSILWILQLDSNLNDISVLLFFIALYSRQERILNLWRHCLRPSTTRVGSRSFGCVFEWFDHPYSFRWRPDGTDESRFFMECSPPHAHFISASNTRWMLECAVSFRLHLQLESILNHASPPVVFVSLYSRQERFFVPFTLDPRTSRLPPGCTSRSVCFRVARSPCGFRDGGCVVEGACFTHRWFTSTRPLHSREWHHISLPRGLFHFVFTSNSNRFRITSLSCFFLSLYIVDRSAFSHRTQSIHGFHLLVLGRPPSSCVSEWIDHRADSDVGAVLSREHVSTRWFHPSLALTISGRGMGSVFRRSRFISSPPPTRFDSSFRISPCCFHRSI